MLTLRDMLGHAVPRQLELWSGPHSAYWHDAPLIVRRLKPDGRVSIAGHAFTLDEAHPYAHSLRPVRRTWIEQRGRPAWQKPRHGAA